MNRVKFTFGLAVAILFCALFQPPLYLHAGPPPATLAREHFGSTSLEWTIFEPYNSAFLSISCPDGRVFRRQFEQGSALSLTLSELAVDYPLPDGSYTYDLTLITGQIVADEEQNSMESVAYHLTGPDVNRQLGGFQLESGAIMDKGRTDSSLKGTDPLPGGAPGGSGELTPMEVQVTQDLCVKGSAAIGNACEVEEELDGTNIMLKENILRFEFDDTSVSPGFPNTDWQMTCNDINSGGLNKLSFENISASRTPFTISGNARTSSLFLGQFGRVGMGTGTPAYPLELSTSGEQADLALIRTDGVSAKCSATQSKMQVGTISNHPIRFLTNNAFAMDLSVYHYLGIGVKNPSYPLQMASGAYCSNGGVWTNASSISLKENIRPLGEEQAMEALEGLKTIRFNYRTEPEEEYLGFIAEEVPDLVSSRGRKGMSAMDVTSLLTRVVQNQQKRLIQLRNRINDLNSNISEK